MRGIPSTHEHCPTTHFHVQMWRYGPCPTTRFHVQMWRYGPCPTIHFHVQMWRYGPCPTIHFHVQMWSYGPCSTIHFHVQMWRYGPWPTTCFHVQMWRYGPCPTIRFPRTHAHCPTSCFHVQMWRYGPSYKISYPPNLPHSAESFRIWTMYSAFLIHLRILRIHKFYWINCIDSPQMDFKFLIQGTVSLMPNGACLSGTERKRLSRESDRWIERGRGGGMWKLFRENSKIFLYVTFWMILDWIYQVLTGMYHIVPSNIVWWLVCYGYFSLMDVLMSLMVQARVWPLRA